MLLIISIYCASHITLGAIKIFLASSGPYFHFVQDLLFVHSSIWKSYDSCLISLRLVVYLNFIRHRFPFFLDVISDHWNPILGKSKKGDFED